MLLHLIERYFFESQPKIPHLETTISRASAGRRGNSLTAAAPSGRCCCQATRCDVTPRHSGCHGDS